MWSKGNTSPLLMGVQAFTAILVVKWQFLRKIVINLLEDPCILVLGIYAKDAPTIPQGHLLNYDGNSFIHISRKWKQNLDDSQQKDG